jgi:hypothetical protein
MSSVRTERRVLQSRTPMIRVDPRALVIVVVACVGMFALSFAVGRALSPASHGGSETLPEFATTQASTAIPVSLSAAPSLKLGSPVAVVLRVKHRPPSVAAVTLTPQTPTPSPLPVFTPQVPPPSSAPVSTTPVAVTPAPARTPASTRPAGGSSTPKHGGGGSISFDSSG